MIGQPSAPALGAGESSSLHVLTAWSNLHALGRMLYIACFKSHALSHMLDATCSKRGSSDFAVGSPAR